MCRAAERLAAAARLLSEDPPLLLENRNGAAERRSDWAEALSVRSISERVLGLVPSAVSYADVRVVRRQHEGIHVENEDVRQVLTEESEGIGLRVLLNGQWGFAATPRLDARGLQAEVRRAVDQARAADGLGPPITLAPAAARQAHFISPVQIDPFSVSFVAKVHLLLEAARRMREGGGPSVVAEVSMDF